MVAGIDDARGVVISSDTGSPTGNQPEVPIAQFEGAWQHSGLASPTSTPGCTASPPTPPSQPCSDGKENTEVTLASVLATVKSSSASSSPNLGSSATRELLVRRRREGIGCCHDLERHFDVRNRPGSRPGVD